MKRTGVQSYDGKTVQIPMSCTSLDLGVTGLKAKRGFVSHWKIFVNKIEDTECTNWRIDSLFYILPWASITS